MDRDQARTLTFVIPGDLQTRTGGYGYDRRIIAGLRDRGWRVDVLSLDGSFPFPTRAARDEAVRAFAAIPAGRTVLVDGLALGVLPEEAERERARLNLIALVHHPLAEETGLDPTTARALENSERRALAAVRSVVVTGESTAALLERYGVGPERIAVVRPGTDPAPVARGSPSASKEDPELTMLCVATLTPRKGHDILFRALAALPHRHWRLRCAGSRDRDPAQVQQLIAQLRREGLEDRVDLLGDLDAERLGVEYDRCDLFVLSTRYEGFGMAVAEALARGLPVVSTATGNIPALVGDEAGIVVAPGDDGAFAEALARLVLDPALRQRYAAGARRVRDRLPAWDNSAEAMERVLTAVPEAVCGTEGGGFSADWLALREPADRAARSARLAQRIAGELPAAVPLRILDLGAGTGANLRYLVSRITAPQRWLLLDHDARLLARAATGDATPASIEAREIDLNTIGDAGARSLFADVALVTASALLDLVSEEWLRQLAGRSREHAAALLFALSYDGRLEFEPGEPEDAEIRDLVNQHQRTDKGFGPALGPDASDVAASILTGLGYHVERDRSDWRLGAESLELQRQLIDGWARAASEIAPARRPAIESWRARRIAHVDVQRSRMVVGHEDLAAWLPQAPRRGVRLQPDPPQSA